MQVESDSREDPAAVVEQKQEDQQVVDGNEDDYIKTTTANYVARCGVQIPGASKVEIKGRSIIDPFVVLRGDLAVIRMGRYSRIGRATTVSPPPLHDNVHTTSSSNNKAHQYVPMTIGNHTWIGQNCQVQAAAIGAYCYIGNHVTLGPRVIIKDACMICDNVTISADTVVPPFTRISNSSNDKSNTSNITMELSPATVHMMQEESMEVYQEFATKQKQRLEQL
jgi:dynactin 5